MTCNGGRDDNSVPHLCQQQAKVQQENLDHVISAFYVLSHHIEHVEK